MSYRLLLLLPLGFLSFLALRADVVPGGPFPADRYSTLWENSPFAVATPVAAESAQYSLVGVAQVDGVSYLSVIDKQGTGDHFVVTSNTPSHGLSLVSLTRDPTSTFATLKKDGGIVKLPLEGGTPTTTPTVIPMTQAPSPSTHGYIRHGPPHFRRSYPPIYVPEPSAVPNNQ